MQGTWIRKMDESEPSIAVVFLHGILSDSEVCWRHKNGTSWPDLLLRNQLFYKLGVYSFTYRTDIFSGSYSLSDVVDALRESLRLDGVNTARKIVFVAHSMGGIVARRYIVQSCDDLIRSDTELGLFLVASPSLGSTYANWFALIAKFTGHVQAQALRFCQSNIWLNDLNADFHALRERRSLVIRGQELVEDQFVVLKKLLFFPQVVQPISAEATFGSGFKVPLSDHFSIAKPSDEKAIQHRKLCEFIEKFLIDGDSAKSVRRCRGGFIASVGASEIRIVVGRIEAHPMGSDTAAVLPCNEYFEDHCAIDTRSALGGYISRHFAAKTHEFASHLKEHCKSRFGVGEQQQKTQTEFSQSYGVGRAILLPDPSQNAALIALVSTTTQRAGQGLAARMSYVFDGIRELFELLADSRINNVVMPVLGAGHGGIDPSLALVGLVTALAESAKYGADKQRRKNITIVVFQRSSDVSPDVSLDCIRKTLEIVAGKATREDAA